MTALPITRPGVRPVAFPPSPHIPDWLCVGNDLPTRRDLPRPVRAEGQGARAEVRT